MGSWVFLMATPPPLLFLSPRVPYPLNTGAKIRTNALLRALLQAFSVDYVGFLQPELPAAEAREQLKACRTVTLFPEPATTRPGKVALALRTLFSSRPATVAKYWSPALAATVRTWLGANPGGILHADHVHMASYLTLGPAALKVMDEHNVEAVIVERLAEQYAKSPAAHFFRLQARRMRATEAALAAAGDLVLAVSEGDAAQLRTMAPTPVEVIPNGVDLQFFSSARAGTQRGRKPGRLVFTGSMNWFPNEDGVLWFMREVWPLLAAQPKPDWSLDVVGHAPSPAVRALATPQIRITGTVDDTRPYVDEAEIFIVPLRIGGGSRLKILEAFAMGIPVISTTVGCEGLGVEPDCHLLIADTPREFADAVTRLRRDPALALRLTTAATHHVRDHFSWTAIGHHLTTLYLQKNHPPRPLTR
jgi:sugar transferase (PEP-CTERM/EpsH1 system associated)